MFFSEMYCADKKKVQLTKLCVALLHRHLPLSEISIEDPVGESLPADPDAFQHTVTAKLVHHQRVLHDPGSLGLVGDDAAHKVRVSGPQGAHQLVQVLLKMDHIKGHSFGIKAIGHSPCQCISLLTEI